MHRRTFLVASAALPLAFHTEAKAAPKSVCVTDHVGQWQSGPNPSRFTIVVESPDENGRFAEPLQRIVDERFRNFRPPFNCVVTFELKQEDGTPWLPLDPPDPTTSQAGFIFESRRFDLIDRAVDYHHSMWRCRYGRPAPDALTWDRENRARRSSLAYVTLTFDIKANESTRS
jgi:hypothetical protein